MNKLMIIGNLTADPELRTTTSGKNVCSFKVAVNRRQKVEGQPDADFFRVSAWNGLADNCSKYLTKGKKVAVVGSVSVHVFESNSGKAGASLEVMAQDVEFLSPKGEAGKVDAQTGYQQVEPDDMPY